MNEVDYTEYRARCASIAQRFSKFDYPLFKKALKNYNKKLCKGDIDSFDQAIMAAWCIEILNWLEEIENKT